MQKEKLKAADKKYLIKNMLYIILIISNILLFMGLINYYSKSGITVQIGTYEYFSSVIPTVIIIGFITAKLSGLRDKGGSLYEISSLVIITIISIMTSYFSGKANTGALFGPYLEMFRILSITLIFVLLATRLKPFKEIMQSKFSKRNLFACFIIFTLLALYATYFTKDFGGTPANVRCMVVMISGLFGGPFVGIPVGIISGAYRFTMGGATALPCAFSSVISGIVGSLFFLLNDKKFPRPLEAIIIMFLFTGFEMLMVVVMTPSDISFPFIHNIYPEMLFASVVGVILFSLAIKNRKEESDTLNDEKEKIIDEIEDEVETNDEIKALKDEIRTLKESIEELKKDKQ